MGNHIKRLDDDLMPMGNEGKNNTKVKNNIHNINYLQHTSCSSTKYNIFTTSLQQSPFAIVCKQHNLDFLSDSPVFVLLDPVQSNFEQSATQCGVKSIEEAKK